MLSYETGKRCYESIRDAELPEKLHPLRVELFRRAIAYAAIRAEWQTASRERRNEMDERRTLAHEAFIDSCNILSRAIGAAGEDISWREQLGSDRKEIGDFACYVACLLGIAAR